MLATYAFAAWLGVAQQKAEQKQLQEQLAWHHVQHVQAGVWNKWRVVFEQQVPQHKLMRAVYRTRRHSTLRKVRHWPPTLTQVPSSVMAVLHSSPCQHKAVRSAHMRVG